MSRTVFITSAAYSIGSMLLFIWSGHDYRVFLMACGGAIAGALYDQASK